MNGDVGQKENVSPSGTDKWGAVEFVDLKGAWSVGLGPRNQVQIWTLCVVATGSSAMPGSTVEECSQKI